MDPLFSSFDSGMSPENTADFEEIMTKSLELGSLSARTMSNALQNIFDAKQFTDMSEDNGNGLTEQTTVPDRIDLTSYFPPPSPVSASPDASFLVLDFEANQHASEEVVITQAQYKGDATHAQKRRSNLLLDQLETSSRHTEQISMDALNQRHSNQKNAREGEINVLIDHRNDIELEQILAVHPRSQVSSQECLTTRNRLTANVDSGGDKCPEALEKPLIQECNAVHRTILNYENTEHGFQALLQLLNESAGPPRKKRRRDYRYSHLEERVPSAQKKNRPGPDPYATDFHTRDLSANNSLKRQNTAVAEPQLPSDAWTALLHSGDGEECIREASAPVRLLQLVHPAAKRTDVMPFIEASDKEAKLKLSEPFDNSWFLCQKPSPNSSLEGVQSGELTNDASFASPNQTNNQLRSTNIPHDVVPRSCSVVPELGSQIEILYPSALGNKSPEQVRSLLRATGGDIVSKIELYWSHFHDYRVSVERAGRLLREKSVRFERRKRMGPDVPAIEKKAIRAQRNRERSQALRRYHKQRMTDLETVSGQLKLYNSVARSLINCLLEEPQSLELVQEYFRSHECSEEFLTYLRGSH
ncbi:unnamed protein product [Agarophyton chilense]|eukprot:gb/GEZJ01004083.1/.p1 GENE.gb/GEZJ01004083.1/~~gb/GEZJ01004083.1/.p1  ORF type:complete len:587 (+),score=91.03 gb/GEZJ01004083.1/:1682-3442(+)